MKKFSQKHELAASAEQVIAMITSEDYLRYRYEDSRLLGFSLDITRDSDDAFACRIERTVDPGDSLPRVAKRLVGERFTICQENGWSRQGPPYQGDLRVTIPGMPGNISGELELQAISDNRSQIVNEGRIEVNIPLAGGQLERMLAGVAEETFAESMRSISGYIEQKA